MEERLNKENVPPEWESMCLTRRGWREGFMKRYPIPFLKPESTSCTRKMCWTDTYKFLAEKNLVETGVTTVMKPSPLVASVLNGIS